MLWGKPTHSICKFPGSEGLGESVWGFLLWVRLSPDERTQRTLVESVEHMLLVCGENLGMGKLSI